MELHGVTLAQYAHVLCAESEGVPLDVALDTFSVDRTAWDDASRAWGQRVARAAVSDEPLLAELDKELELAREHFARRVPPLDEDVHLWLGFLERWAAHPEPMKLLGELGLVEGDIFRLHALWGERLAADEALRKQLESRGASPVRLEDIRPEPRAFDRPGHASDAPAASPPPPPAAAPPLATGAAPPMFDEETAIAPEGPPRAAASPTPFSPPASLLPMRGGEVFIQAMPPPSPAPLDLSSVEEVGEETVSLVEPPPTGGPPPAGKRPSLDTTTDAISPLSGAPMPFGKKPSLQSTTDAVSPLAKAPLPFVPAGTPTPPRDPTHELTLEHYARVCAEVALFPARAEEIFARYGLAHRARRAEIDKAWRDRLAAHPDEYASWRREYIKHQKRYRDRSKT